MNLLFLAIVKLIIIIVCLFFAVNSWLVAVIVIAVVVILGCLFAATSGVGCIFFYCRRIKTPQVTLCAVYEDPDKLPSDPKAADNLAYEHIESGERLTEVRGPVYTKK